MSKHVHVAVATIIDNERNVLLALRQFHQHQGNLWEFPGGKVERGETTYDALKREIAEEVGVDVLEAKPLIEITHDYGDKSVLLDVWLVDKFAGEAEGLEGQTVRWAAISSLDASEFPEANVAIIKALQSL